jgi:hypothetical protein
MVVDVEVPQCNDRGRRRDRREQIGHCVDDVEPKATNGNGQLFVGETRREPKRTARSGKPPSLEVDPPTFYALERIVGEHKGKVESPIIVREFPDQVHRDALSATAGYGERVHEHLASASTHSRHDRVGPSQGR